MTYDMFNSRCERLGGTKDPLSGLDACPISVHSLQGTRPKQTGIMNHCDLPGFESDRITPSRWQVSVVSPDAGKNTASWPPWADRIAKVKSGCRPTPWTARRRTILPSGRRATSSKNMGRRIPCLHRLRQPKIINSRKAACVRNRPQRHGHGCTNT